MAESVTTEISYDLCIIVESPDTLMTGTNLWSGYENLSTSELHRRFNYWNTECKFGNKDIAEMKRSVRIDELTPLANTYLNDPSTLRKWVEHPSNCAEDLVTPNVSSQLKVKYKRQSIARALRNREMLGRVCPAHRLLPVECFKKMKFSKQRFQAELCRVKRLLFGQLGEHIIVASATNQVQVWNLATFQHEDLMVRRGYDFHEIRHMQLSSDESFLIVGTNYGVVVVWDYKRRVELATVEIYDGSIAQFQLSPVPINGSYCLITMNKQGTMTMWRIHYPKNDDDEVLVRTDGPPRRRTLQNRRKRILSRCTCSFSTCGQYVAKSTPNFKIQIYVVDQNFELVCISDEPSFQESVESIVWAHHSSRFIACSQISHARVWNADFKMAVELVPNEDTIMPGMTKAYWSADDMWIITTSEDDDRIYVWDPTEGTIVRLITTEFKIAVPHPILPHLLATVEGSGELQLWDLARDDSCDLHTFVVNNDFELCFASNELIWSPDGTMLIATRRDGMLIMYDLSKGIPAVHAKTRLERLEHRLNVDTDINCR